MKTRISVKPLTATRIVFLFGVVLMFIVLIMVSGCLNGEPEMEIKEIKYLIN